MALRLAYEGADVTLEVARSSLLTGVLLPLPLLASLEARAATTMKTMAGQLVHWEPGVVTVGSDPLAASASVSQTAINMAIEEAAAAWNGLPEMRVKFARARAGEVPAVVVRFCRGQWPGKSNLLGQTQFDASLSSGVVDHASVLINECNYKFVGPEDVAANHLDLQAVLTHEFGHVLGLDHTDDDTAVMYSCTGTIHNRRPNADDRRGLASIYAPELLKSALLPALDVTAKSDRDATSGRTAGPASPVFLMGLNGMFGFELPWPELSNARPVKFVPTVVPMPLRRASAALETRAQRSPPKTEPKPTAKVTPPQAKGSRPDADQPVPSDVAWPESPPAAAPKTRNPAAKAKASR